MSSIKTQRSTKSVNTALLLCILFGLFGVHRFYVGKVASGLLMLLTLGGVGIWWMFDLTKIANGTFTDSQHKYLYFSEKPASLKNTLIVLGSSIATICCYLAAFFIFIFCFTNSLTSPIQNQLAALRVNDMDKAYSYMAHETTANVSLLDFKEYMQRYPVITASNNISIVERKINNGDGTVKGVLRMADGREANVEYLLRKENYIWKIVAIRIGQTRSLDDISYPGLKTYNSYFDRYIIRYPTSWYFQQTAPHAIMMSGKEGTPSYVSSITIQAIPIKTFGSIFTNPKAAINELKKQISFRTFNTKFLDSGVIDLPNEKVRGEYFIVSYTFEGRPMKKMQFMLAQEGKPTIYSYAFTSTSEQFDKDLPIAKAVYESWKFE